MQKVNVGIGDYSTPARVYPCETIVIYMPRLIPTHTTAVIIASVSRMIDARQSLCEYPLKPLCEDMSA